MEATVTETDRHRLYLPTAAKIPINFRYVWGYRQSYQQQNNKI